MKHDLDQITFNQKIIGFISKQNASLVSRYMNDNNIPYIAESAGRRKRYSFEETRKVIKKLVNNTSPVVDQVQIFFNFKGGTGKTTICHQISVHLVLLGYSVLVIDCDPQAHLSSSLGFDGLAIEPTLYDVLINNVSIDDVIKQVYPGMDAIPSNLSMTKIDIPLSAKASREKILQRALQPLKTRYDFILIDTNPTISVLNHSAIYAADKLNIVCETQPYSLKGLNILMEEINNFSSAVERPVHCCIIPNKYESKTVTAQETLGALRHSYKTLVAESLIRRCEEFNISAKRSLPVHAFANLKSIALEDIRDLGSELVKKATKIENKAQIVVS